MVTTPNPMWQRSPPAVSKDGRAVRIDFMVLAELAEHYRIFKVPPADKPRGKR